MLKRHLADLSRGVRYRAELVLLRLKEVGIYRAGADSMLTLEGADRRDIIETVRHVPEDVQRNCRCDAGEAEDLACIGELLGSSGCRGVLDELAESRSGVGEAPGRNLDTELIEGFIDPLYALVLHIFHRCSRMRNSIPIETASFADFGAVVKGFRNSAG